MPKLKPDTDTILALLLAFEQDPDEIAAEILHRVVLDYPEEVKLTREITAHYATYPPGEWPMDGDMEWEEQHTVRDTYSCTGLKMLAWKELVRRSAPEALALLTHVLRQHERRWHVPRTAQHLAAAASDLTQITPSHRRPYPYQPPPIAPAPEGAGKVFATLEEALQDSHWSVRWKAVSILGELYATEAVALLHTALQDRSPSVRVQAHKGLKALNWEFPRTGKERRRAKADQLLARIPGAIAASLFAGVLTTLIGGIIPGAIAIVQPTNWEIVGIVVLFVCGAGLFMGLLMFIGHLLDTSSDLSVTTGFFG